ncbi:hypothetical protein J1N09_01700 [Aureitalea sp. L0-47]|uniref:M61 family metallopeptidase n=1 Tax=Aureitalea sp. L0-47 TaxID=2816962 RepID=UPI0022389B25|nr:hypothetical protein [Aureitalea sp. L0-47]MCW5518535.1 hypothetical protein [Aureitalea sp. L0-47]
MQQLSSSLKTAVLIGLCFIFLNTSLTAQDSYSVSFKPDEPELVEVVATIRLQDSLLRMSNFGPIPENWPKYVSNLKVTTPEGKSVKVEMQDSARWKLPAFLVNTEVLLSYTLNVDHEKEKWPGGIDGVAFVRPWGVMLSGRSLFVMNGSNKENISVQFKVPNEWKLSIPWKKTNASDDSYEVPNLIELQETLLFAGTHKEVNIPSGDFSLKFILGGEGILEQEELYVERAEKVLKYYIELMGGNPVPRPGSELSTAMVLINQSEQVDGEVIGNHLSMFLNPEADMQNQLIGWFMFAHEFFHLWNGKTLRYNDTTTDWFKEGISNYYTLKALNQTGIVNEEITKMVLNNLFYQRYRNDAGYGTMAPANAASGFDKDNHWGLIYGGGLFAGIGMDLEIRHNTNNLKSMDDVMRQLYNEYGGSEKTIDQQRLIDIISEFSKTDFEPFFQKHILGSELVPLERYMPYAGKEVSFDNDQLTIRASEENSEKEKEIWQGFLGNN